MADVALALLTTAPVTAPAATAAPAAAGDSVQQLFATMMASVTKPAVDAAASPIAATTLPAAAATTAPAPTQPVLPVASNDADLPAPVAAKPAMLAALPTVRSPVTKPAARDEDDAPASQQSDTDSDTDTTRQAPFATAPEPIAPSLAALMALPVAPDTAQQMPAATNDTTPAPVAAKTAASVQQNVATPAESPPPAVAQAIAALIANKADMQPVATPVADGDAASDVAATDAKPVAKTDAAPAPKAQAVTRRDTQQAPVDRPAAQHDSHPATETAKPVRDAKRAVATEVAAVAKTDMTPRATEIAATAADAPSAADASMTRTLAVAHDGQWLDSLARDIAATASDSTLRFRLSPEHLGAMTVQIDHADNGASVHLAADSAETRRMLVDAQPRLVAEARAQGLTLRETSVGGGSTDSNPSYTQSGSGNAATADQGRSNGQSARQPATAANLSPARAVKGAPVQTSERYA